MATTITELPFNVKQYIAELDIESYRKMIHLDKEVSNFYSNNIRQNYIKNRFTVIHKDGDSFKHKLNGKIHREDDLPASYTNDMTTQVWCKYGKIYRDNDLPSIIRANDQGILKIWVKNNKVYKPDGKDYMTYTPVPNGIMPIFWRKKVDKFLREMYINF